MQIANPLYDVVFKYLLEDSRVAKLLLSTILGEEIESLELRPQERIHETDRSLTVYRVDFSATIKTKEGGRKLVIIEIQKAKFPSDIMRFRRYLGDHYSNEENSYTEVTEGISKQRALPIISIYFLGYSLEVIKTPVLRVNRQYTDLTTGEEVKEKEYFVESLPHDSYIIQIPHLRKRHQTDLERLLSVFDQSNKKPLDSHLLLIKEEEYPEKYQEVIRRLQQAVAEEELRDKMDIEDDILKDLQDIERQVAEQKELLEEKDKLLEEKDYLLQETEHQIAELLKALEEAKKRGL